ncbi:transposable element Tcb1 transposase [Trichonephila clavipes]|nr:transposable element Tcb1 transposase [Trichonephila clavipes]
MRRYAGRRNGGVSGSSIKHLSVSNHWEVGGRPQCDKCGCRVQGSQHRFTTLRQFQTTGTAIRGFSSGHPRGTTPTDDRYIVLQARRNRRHRRLDSRLTDIALPWPEDGGGLLHDALYGRRLAARTLPPVTIRELLLALQDEWAAMPQQLILSMGRRCETCLAVREIISPY